MMRARMFRAGAICALCLGLTWAGVAHANGYREKGKTTEVADSSMMVTPPRDWNRLSREPGKYTEIWTLDGEQLNDITFYGGVEPGKPLVREADKKHAPLPKLRDNTLLVEVPELLEGTYRAAKQIGTFAITGSKPDQFLGRDGIRFTYEFTDRDAVPKRGEARAVLVDKKLYMATFDAPRIHYYEKTLGDFRALSDTARLGE